MESGNGMETCEGKSATEMTKYEWDGKSVI
jgi:hypothetical protein